MISTLITYAVILAVGFFVWKKYGHLFKSYQEKLNSFQSQMGGASQADTIKAQLQKSGYRHSDIPNASLDEQVKRSQQLLQEQMKTGNSRSEMIRNYKGINQFYYQETSTSFSGHSISSMWSCPNQANSPVLFHIAEQSLVGGLKKLKKSMTNSYERNWSPAFPQKINIHDHDLALRFTLFGDDEMRANQIISQPEIKQILLSFAEVDLRVESDKITFNDPTMENVRGGMGGSMGMLDSSPEEIEKKNEEIHNKVGDLMLLLSK